MQIIANNFQHVLNNKVKYVNRTYNMKNSHLHNKSLIPQKKLRL